MTMTAEKWIGMSLEEREEYNSTHPHCCSCGMPRRFAAFPDLGAEERKKEIASARNWMIGLFILSAGTFAAMTGGMWSVIGAGSIGAAVGGACGSFFGAVQMNSVRSYFVEMHELLLAREASGTAGTSNGNDVSGVQNA